MVASYTACRSSPCGAATGRVRCSKRSLGPGRGWLTLYAVVAFAWLGDCLEQVDWQGTQAPFFLHVHIPKTGGTAFYQQLPRLFGRIKRCKPRKTWEVPVEDAWTQAKSKKGCNFFSFEAGLWMRSLIPSKWDIKTLLIVRDPLPLRISGLEHHRLIHKVDPGRQLTLAAEGLPYEGYPLENQQVKQLLCAPPAGGPKENIASNCTYDLRHAAALLEQTFWVGVTEHFKTSMCVLAWQLGDFSAEKCTCAEGGQRLQFRRRNSHSYRSKKHGCVGCEYRYSVEEMKLLEELNRDDHLLHSMAMARFLSDVDTVRNATGVDILC